MQRSPAASRIRIDFAAINDMALAALPSLLRRWLPDGRIEGREYSAINPTRDDHKLGSFKVNLNTGKWADFATGDKGGDPMNTGKWADFATGDKGGDPISLAAYLAGIGQADTARRVADMLGMNNG